MLSQGFSAGLFSLEESASASDERPVAQRDDCLWLLTFVPDQVHRSPLRGSLIGDRNAWLAGSILTHAGQFVKAPVWRGRRIARIFGSFSPVVRVEPALPASRILQQRGAKLRGSYRRRTATLDYFCASQVISPSRPIFSA